MPVSAKVEQYDFSAHADRNGLFKFLNSYENSSILINHGDSCERFATELQEAGFETTAPEAGSVEII
jgi:putative mRNA 3-end processing factor